MSSRKRVVAFVPIKLQSERVARKNLRLLGGRSLYQYTLETLSALSDRVDTYVFCSDESIVDDLPDGVKFLKRSSVLDQSDTKGAEIYDSFISSVDADYYLLVHTTSPFLKRETILKSIAKVESGDFDSAFAARKIQNFCWFKGRPVNYELNNIPRTQDLEPILEETSGFFIFSKSLWEDERRRIGDTPFVAFLDEIEAVDIDTEFDFQFAEFIVSNPQLQNG